MKRVFCIFICLLAILCSTKSILASDILYFDSFENITDEFVKKAMEEYHIAGVAVSVVDNKEILFSKGYGYSNLEDQKEIDADSSIFQIASISKLFTTTAVMQMVEQGKLELDADINTYLKTFQIDNPFPEPVTIRTLLTHTSGLDYRMPLYTTSKGDKFFDSSENLENILQQQLPPIVRCPGNYCQYSVYGMALAGYLVEVVSGMSIDQYITENIIIPLEMENTSYGLKKEIMPDMVSPYRYFMGNYRMGTYTLMDNHPSGAICSSASDMGKFILFQLNKGMYKNEEILSEEFIEEMQKHQYPKEEKLTGYGLGFYETVRNGYRTIEHGGYLPSAGSKLSILPEKGIGVFIAINTDSVKSSKFCNEYVDLFYEHFTEYKPNQEIDAVFDLDNKLIMGKYAFSEFGLTDYTKIKSVLLTCRVECDAIGNLIFEGNGQKWKFFYIGNGLFYSEDSGNYCKVSFKNNQSYLNIMGGDYSKINRGKEALFLICILSQVIFACCIINWGIRYLKKRKEKLKSIFPFCFMEMGLCIAYFFINALMSVCFILGKTNIIIKIIGPLIYSVCWLAIIFFFFDGSTFVVYSRKNQINLKQKGLYIIIKLLVALNLVFMFSMHGLGVKI